MSTNEFPIAPDQYGDKLKATNTEDLPAALHSIYGENLIAWSWIGETDLKIIAHPDTDLTEFAGVIRDQMDSVVAFDDPLTIYLSKEGSGDVEEILVND